MKYFKPEEVLPKHIPKGMLYRVMDSRILEFADFLRGRYGKIIINDYIFGGNSQYRGLRTIASEYYSPYSQHSFGRAIDCLPQEATVEEIIDDLRGVYLDFPVTVELGVSWLHADVRWQPTIGLYTFNKVE